MDEDLDNMSKEDLMGEVKKLRRAIREHRDSSGHELCLYQPELWSLLPEGKEPLPDVPTWPQFIKGCIAFRQSLDEQLPETPRVDVSFK